MPLSRARDQQIRNSAEELINEGNGLILKMEPLAEGWNIDCRLAPVCVSEFRALAVKSRTFIGMLFGGSNDGKVYMDNIDTLETCIESTQKIVGYLKGLKEAYEKGFLHDLQELVVADISADYMGQAEALLGEGIPGKNDHVPAAVLCGAVLEDALRRMCYRQTPTIPTDRNGNPKTLDPLIIDLQKANVFKKTKAAQLRSWAQIRNSAAHGKFSEFDRNDVESMLKGVKNFLADYL